MEFLGDILSPYHTMLGKIAGTLNLMQSLPGVFMLWDIKKRGQSDSHPPEPFLGGIVLSVISIKLGLCMNDGAMILSNAAGAAINIIYMLLFFYYANKQEFKTQVVKKTIYCSAFIAVILLYAMAENPKYVEIRLGLILTIFLVALIGSPLLQIRTFIQKQSSEGLPLPYIISGTIVGSSWLLYAISIRNSFFIYQNLLLWSLTIVQLAICIIYPNKDKLNDVPKGKSVRKQRHSVSSSEMSDNEIPRTKMNVRSRKANKNSKTEQ